MCGIIGYVGRRPAAEILIQGLRRLEYRGYDSAGVATVPQRGRLSITKAVGRIDQLAARLVQFPVLGQMGIGHTRWATHGPATDINAHPHVGGDELVAVVHNGVIENYRTLKERLQEQGYVFRSATDTEAIAHLVASCLEEQFPDGWSAADVSADDYRPLVTAVQSTLAQLHGTYGLGIVFRDCPGVIIAARLGSPLVIGVGSGEHFVASDAACLAGHTDKIVYMADHELAV